MIFLGILYLLAGLVGYVFCLRWLYRITFKEHDLGSIGGQFWDTVGQEVVALVTFIPWALTVMGGVYLFGIPYGWSVSAFVFVLTLPVVIPWAIAKVIAFVSSLFDLENVWFMTLYMIFIGWVTYPYILYLFLVPSQQVDYYFGQMDSPWQLIGRSTYTVATIDLRYLLFAEVTDQASLTQYTQESANLAHDWNNTREEWGATRKFGFEDYKADAETLGVHHIKMQLMGESAGFSAEAEQTRELTDFWWDDNSPQAFLKTITGK